MAPRAFATVRDVKSQGLHFRNASLFACFLSGRVVSFGPKASFFACIQTRQAKRLAIIRCKLYGLPMKNTVAVLTGDLIGSNNLPPRAIKAAMEVIALCAKEVDPDSRFMRYRGDGWQLRLNNAGDCLFACVFILARLLSTPNVPPTRIAVGIGSEDPNNGPDLSDALGSAFTASGRALDNIRRDEILALDGEGVDDFQRLCFFFAADQITRWTADQAAAMAMILSPEGPTTQEEIAAQFGITRQAVSQRLKSARHGLLEDAILVFHRKYDQRAEKHD